MIDWYWQERPVLIQRKPFLIVKRPCLIVNIDGDEWDRCDKFTQWNDRDRDAYTRGLKPGAVRTGKLGEVACSVLLRQEADFTYRHGGDNHDFYIAGLAIDVKATAGEFQLCYLSVISERGHEYDWKSKDLFIVCKVNEDSQIPCMASVQVAGFFTHSDVAQLPTVPARIGRHQNKELEFAKSRPLPELIDLLRAGGADVSTTEDGRWVGEKYGFEKRAVSDATPSLT